MPPQATNSTSSEPGFCCRFVLHRDDEAARSAQNALVDALNEWNYDLSCRFAVRLAVEEALTNAFTHGNQNDSKKSVILQCRVDKDAIEIEIQDQGKGFDPSAVPDPTRPENLSIPAGRGIVLMRSFMTEVRFLPPGNHVVMKFWRGQ